MRPNKHIADIIARHSTRQIEIKYALVKLPTCACIKLPEVIQKIVDSDHFPNHARPIKP
jgi:hypothetical protein